MRVKLKLMFVDVMDYLLKNHRPGGIKCFAMPYALKDCDKLSTVFGGLISI